MQTKQLAGAAEERFHFHHNYSQFELNGFHLLINQEDEDKVEDVTEGQDIDDVDVDVVTVEKPFYCSRYVFVETVCIY